VEETLGAGAVVTTTTIVDGVYYVSAGTAETLSGYFKSADKA